MRDAEQMTSSMQGNAVLRRWRCPGFIGVAVATAMVLPSARLAAQDATTNSSGQADQIEAEISQIEQALVPLEQQLTDLLANIDGKLDQVRAFKIPNREQQESEPPETEEPKKVKFRPPLLQSDTRLPVFFICRENRVFYMGGNEDFVEQIDKLEKSGPFEIVGSDCTFHLDREIPIFMKVAVERKADAEGTPTEDLLRRRGEFMDLLTRADNSEERLSFFVYPDGYDAFRAARDIAWEEDFNLIWSPQGAGSQLELGVGAGSGSSL